MSLENKPIIEHVALEPGFVAKAIKWGMSNQELVLSYIISFFVAIFIIVIGFYIAQLISRLVSSILAKKGLDETIIDFISAMTRYALISMVVIAALSQLGVQTGSFIAIIGAAGLAIGLALKGSLSDFASGILLVSLRPFKAGDYIETNGIGGCVESIQIFNTTLTTVDNKYVVVPNSAILNGNIVNYSRKSTRRIDLLIRVSYQSDLKQAKQILEDVVLANNKVLTTPVLQIAVAELSTSSVNIVVRPWVKTDDYWAVRFALTENIKSALETAKIKIPFPQLDLHRQ